MQRFSAVPWCIAWISVIAGSSVCPAAVPREVLDSEQSRVAMIERVAPSVVAIFASSGDGGGSGVLVTADGYALSNFHVTNGSGAFMKCGLNNGELYDAVLVGIDPTGDVALIKLLGREDFPAAKLGDSDRVQIGEWAFAMGNPFLLATDYQPTVTAGIVSGIHRYQYPAGTILEYADCIQTDASINPGNSGGPLFNAAGELIGINGRGSFEKRGRVNVGAGYAISINQIKHFWDHLKSGRIVDHATLGAVVRTNFDREVVVDSILEASSAYRRGLREGDKIIAFGGRPIGSTNQFKNVLGIYPDGWKIPLVYRRDEEKHEILVELRNLHRESEFRSAAAAPKPHPKRGPGEPRPPEGPQRPEPNLPEGHPDTEGPPHPERWKHLYEEKEGFANYYFNRIAQERLLTEFTGAASLKERGGRWKMSGVTADGKDFVVTLADRGLGLKLGTGVYFQPLDGTDLIEEPPQTGGLLAALWVWKLMRVSGPGAFSRVVYLGSEPLDGRGPQVDVLLTQIETLQSRWYFDKSDGHFAGFDSTLARDQDACEIRIGETAELGGVRVPTIWTVRSGDHEFATFRTTAIEFLPTASVPAP